MPLIILIISIIILFVLIVKCKLNGFVSLLLACLFIGVVEGLPLMKVITSIETGVGGTLGHLAIILGLGAMFGRIMADGGGAQRISMTLVEKFGRKNVAWAVALTGFIVGITLFWEVSFIVLVPIIYTITIVCEIPLLEVGIPMLSAITVCHCFLPPHPGPIAVAGIFNANIGVVLAYGIIIAIPTLIVAGPLYYKLVKKTGLNPSIPEGMGISKVLDEKELPSFAISVFTALIPVVLIVASLIGGYLLPKGSNIATFFSFIGNTDIALLIAFLVALYTFGFRAGKKMPELMNTSAEAIKVIAMILLIIGGGGAFKQVIIDAGVGNYVAKLMIGLPVSPFILAWAIAAIIRMAIGSATVTLFMASGIVLPILTQTGASPELMVLAVSCGSVFCDPPTDAAFWMVKEFFNLTMSQTLKMWCGLTSVISVMGLAGLMIISTIIS